MNLVIFPVLFYFLHTTPYPAEDEVKSEQDSSGQIIYLVKQRWHTGIVMKLSAIDDSVLDIKKDFSYAEYIDAGWGDEEFYQHPDFDPELAALALFIPTPSVLRIEGFSFDIVKYTELSDIVIRLRLNRKQFDLLCSYINNTFAVNENGEREILNERYSGHIKFYRARGKYHLFNTCNTWVAKVLNEIGINVDENIILAEQLFYQLQFSGEVLKAPD